MGRQEARSVALEHRHTCGPFGLVACVGRRQAFEQPQREEQQREEQRAGCSGHPVFADPPLHQQYADRFDHARRDDEAGAQQRSHRFRGAAPLDIGEHQPPDHPQRQAVEEQAGDVPRRRYHGEQHQRDPRAEDQSGDRPCPALAPELGNDAHPDEFRQGIAQHLCDQQRALVVEREAPAGVVREGRRREGLAESVHRKIGAEGGNAAQHQTGHSGLGGPRRSRVIGGFGHRRIAIHYCFSGMDQIRDEFVTPQACRSTLRGASVTASRIRPSVSSICSSSRSFHSRATSA